MCGIFGSVDSKKIIIDKNILPHRGPDGWSVEYRSIHSSYLTLFQSRLSIIGLGSQGKQPFVKNGHDILIFNGEIYNYLSIKQSLIDNYNINFETETDTEVLYDSLCANGIEKTVEGLNGIFAFAFFKASENKLYLARDPLGIKPLYYFFDKEHFYFCSEIKVFFELNLVKPFLNKDFIGEYFANGWIYEPNTLFKNIYKLESGNLACLDIKNNQLTIKKYWDLSQTNNTIFSTDLNDTLTKVILQQTVSDVPIGVYFSGGIDSSIISFILKDQNALNLNLSLEGSESERVKLFENLYKIPLKKIKYDSNDLAIYNKMTYYMDEPVADPAVIPAYLLALASRKENRIVMLSGMGGDEIDGGYTRSKLLFYLNLLKYLRYVPHFLIIPFLRGKLKRDYIRLTNFSKNCSPENYFSLTSYFSLKEIDSLTNTNWFDKYKKQIDTIVNNHSGIKKFFALEFKGFLTSHNLLYIDKASMAASVEVRVPLLDKDLVNTFFRTINNPALSGKKRLKNVLKHLLKSNYFKNKKQGFHYPIRRWIENDIDWNEILLFFQSNQLLNTELIQLWTKQIKNDFESVSMKLWCVYTLYLWMITFNVEA